MTKTGATSFEVSTSQAHEAGRNCDFWENVRFAFPKSYSTPP